MEPKFRRRGDGHASLFDTEEAKRVKGENRPWVRALSPERVKESAKMAVLRRGGDPENMQHVLGQHQMQFGIFRGQTFHWVAENALGYAGYVVASMSEESGSSDSHNNLANKRAFQGYISHYPAGRYAIQVKREVRSARGQSQPATAAAATSTQPPSSSPRPSASLRAATSTQLLSTSPQPPSTSPQPSASLRAAATSTSSRLSSVPVSSLRSLLIGKGKSQHSIEKSVKRLFAPQKIQPSVPALCPAGSTTAPLLETVKSEPTDSELLLAAEQIQSEIAHTRICLPAGWIPALPEIDQRWIAKTLFRWSRFNQPELDPAKLDRMWWYPPLRSLTSSAIPALEQFFGHPLFLWMPRKLWRVRLLCPHPDCGKSELTSAGLHQKVRQVVGVSSSYYLASE
ncbi:uncharacterized protein LOC119475744 isoform X2 [Sebastes umbrosus]|nr:uncharacterized protein LOC119475744 isoform X2 [Sebastes umbrosus]